MLRPARLANPAQLASFAIALLTNPRLWQEFTRDFADECRRGLEYDLEKYPRVSRFCCWCVGRPVSLSARLSPSPSPSVSL